MAVSHESGPCVTYGQAGGDYNESLGPSLTWGGGALLDPRVGYQPGQPVSNVTLGWSDNYFMAIDQVPSAIATNNIAAAQVPTAGTPLTLVSTSGAGITVGQSVVNLSTGALVTGLLVIDGYPTPIAFGQTGAVAIYDPRTAIARTVRITSVGNDSAATATIRGFDLYGQPMSETQTLTNASVTAGKKAFKFITSVTPAGTLSGSNVSVGTGDLYGFPLLCTQFPLLDIFFGTPPQGIVTSPTGFTAADTTSPATATTGDVRGTYATQSASDGTKKLHIFITIAPYNLFPQPGTVTALTGNYTGLFGQPNFTN